MKPLRNKTPSRNTVPKSKMGAKDPVEVFCRIRPSENNTDSVCLKSIGKNTVQLTSPDFLAQKNGSQEINGLGLEYTFRYVFDNSDTQKDLFDRCALPLVEDLIRGKNGLIFTYGVTSSGKTFTMTGTPNDCGLLPRCFDVLFNTINDYQANKYVFKPDKGNSYELLSSADAMLEMQREINSSVPKTPKLKRKAKIAEWGQRETDETKVEGVDSDSAYAVFISYIEIYNNHIFDLLEEAAVDQIKEKIQSKILRTDSKSNMYVFGATEIEVKSADDAFEVFWKGQQRRRVAHTALNTESSRSHSVFTIRLVQAPLDIRGVEVNTDKNYLGISQLSLVDLAGSERTQRTRNTGNRLKEASNINNSLMVLRQCIEILREKQNNPQLSGKMIPYRDNKLTLLFKSFFEGEGRVRMIVCAHPGMEEYDETLQVMKFAEMTQEVLITRPAEQIAKPIFTRGRRELYEQQQREKINADLVDYSRRVSLGIYSLGPAFPEFDSRIMYNDITSETILSNLEQGLVARTAKRNEMISILNDSQSKIRNSLLDIQRENQETKPQLVACQMDLEAREHQLRTLERKQASTEQSNEVLRKKVSDYEFKKRNLQHQLSEKDYLLNRGEAERAKITNEMEDRLEMERERMKRVMEYRLAMKQAELERKMCMTDEKFGMLREILNSGDWALPDNLGLPAYYNSNGRATTIPSAVSEPQLNKLINTPSGGRGGKVNSAVQALQKRTAERIGGSKKLGGRGILIGRGEGGGIPAANPRHRRSLSADVWIDHVPAGSVETGTVLKPTFKKRKSVSKLDEKDFQQQEGGKYVLTHQEQSSAGELETQLYKGNIIPSAGGGAQVIFNDVEYLRQSSPPSPRINTLRKRSAEGRVIMDKDEIESRCKVALEGKPQILTKKPRN